MKNTIYILNKNVWVSIINKYKITIYVIPFILLIKKIIVQNNYS